MINKSATKCATMPKLYSIDIPVYATAYIKADSAEEAQALARKLRHATIEVTGSTSDSDVTISGGPYGDLPDVSLSPVMTIGRFAADAIEEA